MAQSDLFSSVAPAALVFLGLLWGASRVIYLRKQQGVTVLSVSSQPKTVTDIGLAVLGTVLDVYLLARPFVSGLDVIVHAWAFAVPVTGFLIMLSGLVIVGVSQLQMGGAWRIGVPAEKEQHQRVVRSGLYSISRNPIYLGIFLFVFGAFLAVPGPLTLLCLIGCLLLVPRLVAREEAFMHRSFGPDFEDYCQTVRRWL